MGAFSRPGEALLLLLGGLILLAVLSGSGLVWTAAVLTGLVGGTVQLWGRYALTRLEYSRQFSPNRCFAGEEVELRVEMTNRKLLPVTYLAVDDTVPDELELGSRRVRYLQLGRGSLRLLYGLSWYQKVIRHLRVKTTRRGFYRVGPARLSGGDPFGYITQSQEAGGVTTLVVYPRVLPLEALGIPHRRPFGEIRGGSRLFEDPLFFAGIRGYEPGDPLSRINWKAAAATGSLQVRRQDPSSSPGLCVFLNTWSYELPWMGSDSSAFEAGCVLSASILDWAVAESVPAGLFANGLVHEWGLNLRIEPSRKPDLLITALEGLARLQVGQGEPLARLIADETPRLSYGTSVVIISRRLSDDLLGAAIDVHRSGRPVTLVITGPELPATHHLGGIRLYHVPGEEALHASALA